MSISFVLNGKSTTLDADPNMPLLWAVREVIGLPGTKFGCGMALCGACTVHLDGQAIRSCVMPLSAVAGHEVTTIECLQSKPAKAVQAAWIALQVPQCGYCQSGQVMSAIPPPGWRSRRSRAASCPSPRRRCGSPTRPTMTTKGWC